MEKSADAFRTISEVAEALDTPAHVLRFWESRFEQVRPVKGAGGRRYYRPFDMALLEAIRRLLHDEGVTIRGVQKLLDEKGAGFLAGMDEPAGARPSAQILLHRPKTARSPKRRPARLGDDLGAEALGADSEAAFSPPDSPAALLLTDPVLPQQLSGKTLAETLSKSLAATLPSVPQSSVQPSSVQPSGAPNFTQFDAPEPPAPEAPTPAPVPEAPMALDVPLESAAVLPFGTLESREAERRAKLRARAKARLTQDEQPDLFGNIFAEDDRLDTPLVEPDTAPAAPERPAPVAKPAPQGVHAREGVVPQAEGRPQPPLAAPAPIAPPDPLAPPAPQGVHARQGMVPQAEDAPQAEVPAQAKAAPQAEAPASPTLSSLADQLKSLSPADLSEAERARVREALARAMAAHRARDPQG